MKEGLKPNSHANKQKRAFWRSPAGKSVKARLSATNQGRSQPKNLGRTGPGRKKDGGRSAAVPDWKIARALTSGRSAGEAANELGMEVRTLASRAERVGLAYGSVFICDQGIPFRDKTLTAIRTASGFLTAGQFEEFVGLAARSCTARKGGPEAIRVPEFARDVMAWRDRAIRSLVESTKDKDRPYHNHQVIHTFLPTLASLRDALAEAFGKSIGRLAKPRGIQAALREHPEWDIEDVWNFTAEQSRANRNSGAWHRTLCYLWEIESIIESKLERLRETEGITDFVREVLGERYGVHPQQIKLAMQSGVRTIGPVEMARLLLLSPSLRQFAQSVPQGQRAMKKRKHGPDKLPSEETTWFMLGHSVEEGLASGLGLVEARKAVVGRYEYDTIVRYHRMYRKHLKREF